MQNYHFTLILAEPEESEEDADRLYSQLNDGTIVTTNEVTLVEFDRKSASLREAIASAIVNVEQAGFRVARVETPESHLVDDINADLMSTH